MRGEVRRRIEMGSRVREFSRSHPSDDPSHTTLLVRLEDRLNRAEVLAVQERAGRIAESAAAGRRDELRRSMQKRLLRHLVRAGELAARENPELAGKFRLRLPNATHKAFLISARAMLADGVANKDLLVSQGLSEKMLGELGQAVGEFEATTDAGGIGRRNHIGARLDLEAVSNELVALVELLNTFNSHRFRSDPELAGMWESARTVFGPSRSKPAAPPTEGGVTPPAGGIASAA
jgi:hypothetical protein